MFETSDQKNLKCSFLSLNGFNLTLDPKKLLSLKTALLNHYNFTLIIQLAPNVFLVFKGRLVINVIKNINITLFNQLTSSFTP